MSRILLVEDNQVNADMLVRRLTRRGFEVTVAPDGLAAVAFAAECRFDLILMDMSLPYIDGWDATRQIRRSPATATTPIIALTAHAMLSDRERSLEAGCNDFETKPIDMARLLAKIDTLLAQTVRT